MARKELANPKAKRSRWKKGKRPVTLDELGGSPDGGLAILTPEGERIHTAPARVANSLRFFLARVDLPAPDGGMPDRVAITSALRGEGVTFITRSLAAVLAYDHDVTVAIVDLNWQLPKHAENHHEENGEESRWMLVDAVEGGVPIDKIVEPTANRRLSMINAGALSLAKRPAMAGSKSLEAVIDAIAERFDHVILDLPPVLASSDAIRLAQLADEFILVVRQGATATKQVESALEELRNSEALGVILNRYDSKIPRALRRMVGA
jgi:Mrp family chromosome partitioning ATPase